MPLLAAFGAPRNLHAFKKFYAGLLFLICCMPEYTDPVKPAVYICLLTYRNEAVCLMFVQGLYYFLLELY